MMERHRRFVGRVGSQRFQSSGDDTPATALLESREATESLDVDRRERMSRGVAGAIEPDVIKPVAIIGHEPHFGLEHLDNLKVELK